MQKFADFIRRIEIDSLWSGKKHIVWNLNPHVNILSGINGVGKSTILNKVVRGLAEFKRKSSVILANRWDEALADVREKVYTRDIFKRD